MQSQVQKVEYFFDTDPGYGKGINPGSPVMTEDLTAKVYEELSFNASVNTLQNGYHTLYIRAKNTHGWSQTQSRSFIKVNLSGEEVNRVKYVEYFFDSDPGYGEGTSVDLTSDDNLYTFEPFIQPLTNGLHTLYIRVQNQDNGWSQVMNRSFVKTILPSDLASELTAVEYYIDTDPGVGKAIPLAFSPDNNVIDFTADLTDISTGNHVLYIRGKNHFGQWKSVGFHTFSVIDTGIDELSASETVFYPNPVVDVLFIRNANTLIKEIEIIDSFGNICMKQKNDANTPVIQVSLNGYPAGLYFVKINSERGNKSIKILKK